MVRPLEDGESRAIQQRFEQPAERAVFTADVVGELGRVNPLAGILHGASHPSLDRFIGIGGFEIEGISLEISLLAEKSNVRNKAKILFHFMIRFSFKT